MAEPNTPAGRRAVFLDRDGTIIEDVDFLRDESEIRLLPGAVEGIRLLREAGFLVIVATNQSGVARGYLTEKKLRAVHTTLLEELARQSARLDAIYYCPHHPEGSVREYAIECDCRKPAPGLLLRAARQWNVNLAASFVVGDSERDVLAGKRAGCRTVLISAARPAKTAADDAAPDFLEAARLIVARRENP